MWHAATFDRESIVVAGGCAGRVLTNRTLTAEAYYFWYASDMNQIAVTYRRRLRKAANRGFVTPTTADAAGVPQIEVRKLASRGWLDHVARGVYCFADLVDDERAQFYEAVLSVGPDAYLTRDAVLAFHDLALVNPRRIRVGTKRRVRRQLPDYIEVVREDLPASDLTSYDGLASATVARALRDCIGTVMTDRLVDATQHARDEGLIRRREHAGLLEELGADR
jgi:predicted transcriptional regulator of viral defense system